MNIFIICSVRGMDNKYRKKLENYAATLEKDGHKVHLPHRDTNQNTKGYYICHENARAIRNSHEVHIFYSPNSLGTHFDMGVAFAMNKKIVIVESIKFDENKSFPRMLTEWVDHYQDDPSIQDMADLVEDINFKLYEIFGDDSYLYELSVETNSSSSIIKYLGFVIWSSEDDERKFNEDINEYETLEKFIYRQIKKIKKKIKKIEL